MAVKRLKSQTDELLRHCATALQAIAHGDAAGPGSGSEESRLTQGKKNFDSESPWLHSLRDEAGALTATGVKLESLLRRLPPSPDAEGDAGLRSTRPTAGRPKAGTGSADASFSHEDDDDGHDDDHRHETVRLFRRHATAAPPAPPVRTRGSLRSRSRSLAASALAKGFESESASEAASTRDSDSELSSGLGIASGSACDIKAAHGGGAAVGEGRRHGGAHASGELIAAASAWLSLVREHCNTCVERVGRERAAAVRLQGELALRQSAATA